MQEHKPKDKKLWDKIKKEADKIYDKPSAYKSGYIVKKYKLAGGKFDSGKKKNDGLTRWFKEKWRNQHMEEGYEHKNDIYRPTIRVNKKTPTTMSELDHKQIIKAQKIKANGKRVKNFNKL